MGEDDSDKTLGIDLGTTNSAMAIIEADEPRMLQNNEGDPLTPSVVYYPEDGSPEVGKAADSRASSYPASTEREVKLEIGNSEYRFETHGDVYSSVDVSAEILKKLRSDAGDYLGGMPTEAVITVPAYFTSDQKRNTLKAGKEAGFEDVQLTDEPVAATFAYEEEAEEQTDGNVLVFDFGGGTLDISIINIDNDPDEDLDARYEVLVSEGNNSLGGSDFDEAISLHLAKQISDIEVDPDELLDDPEIKENLRASAERAKIELSSSDEVDVTKPYLGMMDGEPVALDQTLSRDEFENLIDEHLEEIREEIRSALDNAGLSGSDLEMVLLVGGSTYIPAVREIVEEETGVEPNRSRDPDQIVGMGAAVYAERAITKVEGEDEGDDKGEGGEKKTGTDDIEVIERVTRSIGTRLVDGSFDSIVEKGIEVSEAEGTGLYTTVEDNQTIVTIDVYQGESERAEDNEKLDEFKLRDIPEMPKGDPEIEVTFCIDKNGILQIEAEELKSGTSVIGEVEEDWSS